MKYKPSYYNFFARSLFGNAFIAYNGFTGSLNQLSANDYDTVKRILVGEDDFGNCKRWLDIWNILKDGGYIVEDDKSQYEQIVHQNQEGKHSKKTLSLTVAPTLACNLRCIYCYERHSKEKMSEQVQDALVELTKRRLQKNGILNMTWYGGEPLLEFGIISNLSRRLIELCEERNATYMANIITNGLKLDGQMAKKLSELRINDAQVTIDGLEQVHDLRRPDVNGNCTFNKIISNLKITIFR